MLRQKLALLLSACLLVMPLQTAAADSGRAKQDETIATHSIIGEPESFTQAFYGSNSDDSHLTDLTEKWVDGVKGKGLQLNGSGDQIRFDPRWMNSLDEMTIDLWVNWKGDATPETPGPDTGYWWQSLLGMSGPGGNLFKLMPANFNNTDFNIDGAILDGLALDMTKNGSQHYMLYKPVPGGQPANALPIGEWTYIAISFDGNTAKLYRNGELFAQADCPYKPKDFGFDLARIGSYFTVDFFNLPLNGIVDEANLYEKALSAEQLAQIYQNIKNPVEPPKPVSLFDEDGRYRVVDELSDFRDGLYARVQNFGSVDPIADTSGNWEQGIDGQAIRLDGKGQHILVDKNIGKEITQEMSLEAWVKFEGDATPDTSGPDTGFWWQSLFSFSGPGGNWLKAMPAHFNNTDYRNGSMILDGAAVELQHNLDTGGPKTTVFQPVEEGSGGNALPEGDWSYFVFTLDGAAARLYVNGVLTAETPCNVKPGDFRWDAFRIGNHFVQDQFNVPFNGCLDDTSIYNRVLTSEEVAENYKAICPDPVNPQPPVEPEKVFAADGSYTVVSEPSDFRDGLYSKVENFSSVGKIENNADWTEGISGKGLKLNGEGQHVLVDNRVRRELNGEMTFETWVKFGGDATPDSTGPDTGYWWQSLVSFSGAGGNWLKAMPAHYNNTDYKNGTMILDGPAIEFQRDFDTGGPKVTLYQPVKEGSGGNALPENEWSHFAFTMDGSYVRLYINGKMIAQTACNMKPEDFHWDAFRIGSHFVQDKFNPAFNGTLDETRLYNRVLSAGEIQADYNKLAPKGNLTQPKKAFDTNGAYQILGSTGLVNGKIYSSVKDFQSIGLVSSPKWEEGVNGKALRLNGKGQHVLIADKLQKELDSTFSFETWVRFEGDATPESSGPDTGYWWQSLFAFSGPGGNWIKGMPAHYNDTDYKTGGTILDGPAVEVQQDWDNGGKKTTVFQPVQTGAKSLALPTGKWSHFAFTMDGSKLRMYIDGVLTAETSCNIKASELNLDTFRIGDYFTEDQFNVPLNAALSDTAIYSRRLSDSEIKADYEQGKDRAAALSGSLFTDGKYTIVDEPGDFTASLYAGADDNSKITDSSPFWVDGIKGKGIELDGLGRHIRFDPKVFQDTKEASISLCVNWRGDATPDTTGPDTGFWWQTLLGLSGPNGNLFRLMPSHYNNTDMQKGDTHLDGLALETLKNDSEKGVIYQPVKDGDSTTSLVLNGWNNVVVTVDGSMIKIYVNGKQFAQQEWSHTLDEYNFDLARIGMYYLVDKFNVPLNAVVDEVSVYNKALSGEEAAAVAAQYDGLLTDRVMITDTPSDFKPLYLESLDYSGAYPVEKPRGGDTPTALIVGLSVGGAALALGGGGTFWFLRRRKRLAAILASK